MKTIACAAVMLGFPVLVAWIALGAWAGGS